MSIQYSRAECDHAYKYGILRHLPPFSVRANLRHRTLPAVGVRHSAQPALGRHHERTFRSLLYHHRACPSSLGRRSSPRPLPPPSRPNLMLLSNCIFPPARDHLRKNNSRSLSAHGLHMLPPSDSRHHRFFDMPMQFPRVPPPAANCSSLEVMHAVPSLQTMIYMRSQRGISPRLSCRPAEMFPAHVTDIVPRSPTLSF